MRTSVIGTEPTCAYLSATSIIGANQTQFLCAVTTDSGSERKFLTDSPVGYGEPEQWPGCTHVNS
jgi:hypothetical protein